MELINASIAQDNVLKAYNLIREDIIGRQLPAYITGLNEKIKEKSSIGITCITYNLPLYADTDIGHFSMNCFIKELEKIVTEAGYTLQKDKVQITLRW